jgi:competence protein ComEA
VPNPLKDFFAFTKGERQGIIFLLFILVLLLLANILMPFFIKQQPSDFSEFAKEIETFEKQFQKDSTSGNNYKKFNPIDESFQNTDEKNGYEKKNTKPFVKDFTKKIYDYPKKEYTYNKLHIDINSADTTELMKLRGIGPTFAKRIVKYREMLGGYHTIEQLMEVYGMDSEKYDMVKDEVYVSDSLIKKINLNKATAKELSAHIYIDWKLANAITNYRFKNKFETIDELKEIYLVNDSLFRKLAPYFFVEK